MEELIRKANVLMEALAHTNGRALTAASHEHVHRVRVGDHARLHQRLVINELVQLRGLGFAIQDQTAAVQRRILNEYVLEFGPPFVDHAGDALHLNEIRRDVLVVPISF
jgi:hypothetical protein